MPQTVNVSDTFIHLPIGVLTPALDGNGPYGAGNHALTTWLDGATLRNVSDTFGVIVQINGAIAPKLGRVQGFDDGGTVNLELFEFRITQLAALHQTLFGTWVATQVQDVFYAPYMTRWAEDLPGKIGLYVSPTWSVDLYYLKTI